MSDYLSPAELAELTGHRQRPAQIAWLKRRRWRHEVSGRGDPRVLRAYRDRRLLDDSNPAPDSAGPDFSSLARA